MQDYTAFCLARFRAAFHRRRIFPLGSDDRRATVGEARTFLHHYRRETRSDHESQQGDTRAATIVRDMAARQGVSYTPTPSDDWANDVSRVSGDEIKLDEIELLLIELQRVGYLNRSEVASFQTRYLREKPPFAPRPRANKATLTAAMIARPAAPK